MKVLIIEDEPSISRIIHQELQKSGYLVDSCEDGIKAQEKLEAYDYDIIILDIMLPGADGYEICKRIRSMNLNSKVIMLTAKDDLDSKISGLNMGADDYMTKPFSLKELEARIRALSRREKVAPTMKIKNKYFSLNMESKKVTVNNKPLKTTPIEFRILTFLLKNQHRVCTRTMLQENVWGEKHYISNIMNVTISKLRSKIRKLNNGKDLIITIPKSGYKII